MKHDYIKKQMQNHLPKGIHDALTGTQPMASPQPLRRRGDWEQVRPNLKKIGKPPNGAFLPPPPWEGGRGGGLVLPKGPPGRSRSPGAGNGQYTGQPPDAAATPDRVQNPVGGNDNNRIPLNTEYQILNDKQIPNFYSRLIFTIMKKQILFLAFFVLVALASVTDSYGQLLPGVTRPTTTTCTGEPLHPYAGVPYDYSVTIGNGVTVPAAGYTWWATKDANFITASGTVNYTTSALTVASGDLIATGAGYGTVSGTATMTITWSPGILAKTEYQGNASTTVFPSPTFVAVVANGSCTNNIQVYEINPKPAFIVDVTNIDPSTLTSTTIGSTVSQCVDEVQSAIYNSGTKEIDMDYGTNTLYFEVIAANFVTNWLPLFEIVSGSLAGDQTADIGWASSLANAQAGTFIQSFTALADGATASGTTVITADPSITNTTQGVSLYVRVVIHNNQEESLALRPFTLAVDGVDSTGEWDLVNVGCTEPNNPDQLDLAVQDITPRPDINDATNDTQTDPDTFIEKTNP